jgi:hypothetical protein
MTGTTTVQMRTMQKTALEPSLININQSRSSMPYTLATTLQGYVYTKRLAVGGPSDWCLLFRNRKGDDALAFWRAAGSAAPLNLPLISQQAVLVSMLGTRSDARDAMQAVFTREPQYMLLGKNPRPAKPEPMAPNYKGK